MAGPGAGPFAATDRPNSEPARGAYTATDMVRRDVTTRTVKESAGAFGNDYVRGGGGKDDVYGLLGNDWLEGNEDEDAIVGDMGKIVDNQLGGPTPDTIADPPLNQFIAPNQPFLGSTINYAGTLKREVTLYAFDESAPATAGIGHDVALGGDGNDAIHTGPGQDLANGNAGDDRIWLGDNAEDKLSTSRTGSPRRTTRSTPPGAAAATTTSGAATAPTTSTSGRAARRPTPGVVPTSDPETWFQVAGGEASHNAVVYGQESFEGIDYLYGGWDQDTMQANEGDNGPKPGDRLLDWAGVYNALLPLPVHLRRLGLDPSRRAGPDRLPAVDVAGLRRDDDRDGRHVRLPRDGDRVPERAGQEREPDPPGHARALHLRSRHRHSVSPRIGALAAAVLLVAAGGCGGGGDDATGTTTATAPASEPTVEATTTDTRPEPPEDQGRWARQVDAACKPWQSQIDAVAPPSGAADLERWLGETLPLVRKQVAAVEAVKPPVEDERGRARGALRRGPQEGRARSDAVSRGARRR